MTDPIKEVDEAALVEPQTPPESDQTLTGNASPESGSNALDATTADSAAASPEETLKDETSSRSEGIAASPDAATLAAVAAVEAMLYASGKPAPVERLAEAAELSVEDVEAALQILARLCDDPGRGIRLDRVAGGVRLVSRPEFDYPVRRLLGLDGKNKLSMAALETLAIMAYRQPVTAPEVAELRGVNSASSIRTLLDRKLITTAGRKEVVGTPFLYKTTKEFLVHFGLTDLKELPKPEELESLYGIETPGTPDPSQTELFSEAEVEGSEDNASDASEAEAETNPPEILSDEPDLDEPASAVKTDTTDTTASGVAAPENPPARLTDEETS